MIRRYFLEGLIVFDSRTDRQVRLPNAAKSRDLGSGIWACIYSRRYHCTWTLQHTILHLLAVECSTRPITGCCSCNANLPLHLTRPFADSIPKRHHSTFNTASWLLILSTRYSRRKMCGPTCNLWILISCSICKLDDQCFVRLLSWDPIPFLL